MAISRSIVLLQLAGSVSTRLRQEADLRCVRPADQGQLTATIGKTRYRPLPVIRSARESPRQRPVSSTAAIGRRPLEAAHSPKQSLKIWRCSSTLDAGRTSAVRPAELELPTLTCQPWRSAVGQANSRSILDCFTLPYLLPPTSCAASAPRQTDFRIEMIPLGEGQPGRRC